MTQTQREEAFKEFNDDHLFADPAQLNGSLGKCLWIDIPKPTDSDWERLAQHFQFHPLALEDARTASQRAKVDGYEGYYYLCLHAWSGETPGRHQQAPICEIDVFIGPDYLVTIHDGRCPSIAEARRRWQKRPDPQPEGRDTPAYLLYLLIDSIVDDAFPLVDRLDEMIDDMETKIYSDNEFSSDIKPALKLKKNLLLTRQTIAGMRDVMTSIMRSNNAMLVPTELYIFYQDVYDHVIRLVEQVDLHRDLLSGAMDAMVAQTSNRLNKVMKTMTAIATILMSIAIIPGIYGMNFENMPELKTHNGYFICLGVMTTLGVSLATYFRKIGWF